MSRDKARDDRLFNCDQEHEIDYVVSLYDDQHKEQVRKLIKDCCADNTFSNSTHKDVYQMIKDKLGIERN